ncbi:T9SS type A sorting domain-containing protein [bacterium]|nr:T9SS type A sorting domain-containing protein [bacterium]
MKRLLQISGLILLMSTTAFCEYSWHEAPSMNQARSDFMAAAVNGNIYVFGGIGSDRRDILSSTEVFSSENNQWRTLSEMPTPLFRASAVSVNENIYIIGGYTNNNNFNAGVFLYNTTRDTFITVARMPEPYRFSHSAVLVGDRILVMGGITENDARLNTGMWFSPRTQRWEDGPQLRTPAVNFGMVEKDGDVYLAGGVFYVPLDRLEILSGDRWTAGASMPIGRNGLGLAFLGDTLYAAGGRTNSRPDITTRVDHYLPQRDAWFGTSDMQNPRVDFQLVSVNRRLYAIGGHVPGHQGVLASASVEVYYYTNGIEGNDSPSNPVLMPYAFPNPCNGPVNFTFPPVQANLTLYDLNGRILREYLVSSAGGTWSWNTGNHPAGIYFYRYSPLNPSESVIGSVTVVK